MRVRIVAGHRSKNGEECDVKPATFVWWQLDKAPIGTVVDCWGIRYEKVAS